MTDSQLRSIHLEGLPRRQDYREARARLKDACGEQTLMGAIGDLPFDHPAMNADAATLCGPPASQCTYMLIEKDHEYPLGVGINTIGRMSDNGVAIRDEHVSRRHCAIVIHQDGRCEIYDVASKNGTIVNGQKIPGTTPIKDGDLIMLCTRRLTFVIKPVNDPLAGCL
jgi:hypothetical protein